MADEDDLTPSESAILIVLMAEAREILNTELKERYRIDVYKNYRDKLNRLRLVASRKSGNTWAHQLDDRGWVRVQSDLNFDSPRARALGGALVALQVNLRDRVLTRGDYSSFSELFSQSDIRVSSSAPDAEANLRVRIRNAYAALASEPGAWVSMTRLRPFFGDLPVSELDDALRKLHREPDVNIAPESNQKMLTAADVEAALHVGGQDKHLLAIGV
ncbi:MAG TPA: hypothetical protein VHT50_00320 [Mycobacterium sp.]|jgi:hypothetical protein|nr:hypothetical protein [Mycobacterium sp.]